MNKQLSEAVDRAARLLEAVGIPNWHPEMVLPGRFQDFLIVRTGPGEAKLVPQSGRLELIGEDPVPEVDGGQMAYYALITTGSTSEFISVAVEPDGRTSLISRGDINIPEYLLAKWANEKGPS